MNTIDYFTNIEDFEAILRNRSESNIFILAEKLEVEALDLSLILCENFETNNNKWIEELSIKLNKNYETILGAMIELWLEVGDEVKSSPLISKETLRF